MTRKTWDQFRATGLAVFINQMLHIFGWAIVFEVDSKTNLVTSCYPARVKYRGFSEEDQSEAYKKVSKYLSENIEEIDKENNE